MSTPLDKLFGPPKPMQQDVTAPPRLPIAGEENVGWREFVRQFLPEGIRDKIVESTPVAKEMEKRRKISAATPYRAEGGKRFVTSKEEMDRVQRERYEQMEREMVLPPGMQVLRERNPTLFEKVIPASIREEFRPTTRTTESPEGIAANVGFKALESVADISNMEPGALPKTLAAFPFFSKVEKAIEGAQQAKMHGKEWLGVLKKFGTNETELAEIGLKELLEQNANRPVLREDILSFMEKGKERITPKIIEHKELTEEELQGADPSSGWAKYGLGGLRHPYYNVMPGGQNRKEILATLPNYPTEFMGAHWTEPNTIGHALTDTRQAIGPEYAQGKKVYGAWEIQSDWAQKGRKKGFIDTEAKDVAPDITDDDLLNIHRRNYSPYGTYDPFAKKHRFFRTSDQRFRFDDKISDRIDKMMEADDLETLEKANALHEDFFNNKYKYGNLTFDYNGKKYTVLPDEFQDSNVIMLSDGDVQTAIKPTKAGIMKGIQVLEDKVENFPFKATSDWVDMMLGASLEDAIKARADYFATAPASSQIEMHGSQLVQWKPEGDGFKVYASSYGPTDIEGFDGFPVKSKEDLKDYFRNAAVFDEDEIDEMSGKIWDRMQKNPTGEAKPREEGLREFYGKIIPTRLKKMVEKLTKDPVVIEMIEVPYNKQTRYFKFRNRKGEVVRSPNHAELDKLLKKEKDEVEAEFRDRIKIAKDKMNAEYDVYAKNAGTIDEDRDKLTAAVDAYDKVIEERNNVIDKINNSRGYDVDEVAAKKEVPAVRITPELVKNFLEKGVPLLGLGAIAGGAAAAQAKPQSNPKSKKETKPNPLDRLFH